MRNIADTLEKKLGKSWKSTLAVIIGISGMVILLIIPTSDTLGKKQVDTDKNTTQAYTANLEHRLTQLVSSIEGVGNANVMITLEGGIKYVYAKEQKLSTDKLEDINKDVYSRIQQRDNAEESYILVEGENGNKNALVQQEVEPVIKGVVVVCEGGGSVIIEQRITQVITTALNIPSTKVCVAKISK